MQNPIFYSYLLMAGWELSASLGIQPTIPNPPPLPHPHYEPPDWESPRRGEKELKLKVKS
jgi:hypothetical protein